MMAAHILIAAEGLTALKKHNVPPEVALAAINGSSGRSWATLQRIPDNVLSRKFDYNFSLELLNKDVQTCMDGVFVDPDPAKAGFPLLTLGAERVATAFEKLGGDADHTEIVKLSEAETGTILDR
uniref:3-hydroxyisobutyrate dehydrogenase-like NAD-binding domain-containing protein n=1 Tax=Florenciella parvula TaxID=236787 RepID=A0A7S2FGM8_9STRA|mmetsp:Transcript_15817/g.33036  ORF Transcript_15817/g.33036 Transcript_15817/m.33036 type:complete len:125 (+) Transcript_15817:1-375(+)